MSDMLQAVGHHILIVPHPWAVMRPCTRWECKSSTTTTSSICLDSAARRRRRRRSGDGPVCGFIYLYLYFGFFFYPYVRKRKKEKKEKLLRWVGDKARLHSCYDNSYTPISLFFFFFCRILCCHLCQTHTHANTSIYCTHIYRWLTHTHTYKSLWYTWRRRPRPLEKINK